MRSFVTLDMTQHKTEFYMYFLFADIRKTVREIYEMLYATLRITSIRDVIRNFNLRSCYMYFLHIEHR